MIEKIYTDGDVRINPHLTLQNTFWVRNGAAFKNSQGRNQHYQLCEKIRLRWRYAGERYSLKLPHAYLPENLHHCTL